MTKNTAVIKSIKLTVNQWADILRLLHAEYPKSLFLIRDRMRAKLGFSVRNHLDFVLDVGYANTVYLDFYSEQKRTMFLLKFGEHLQEKELPYEN